MQTNYPQTVKKWLDEVYSQLEEDGFFSDDRLGLVSPEITKNAFYEIVGEEAFNSWLNESEVKIEKTVMGELLFKVVIKSNVEELKISGHIDHIDNENGEEIIWLTKQGKNKLKNL